MINLFKSTGVVRRIDIAGRISIPKEIRKKHRLDEDDPVEIGEDEENIVLRKYSAVGQFSDSSKSILDSFSYVTGLPVILCDTDMVIYSQKTALLSGKRISDELYEHIKKKAERCLSMQVLQDGSVISSEIEIIYSQSRAVVGALIIPECDREITESQMDCLRLCAKAIGQLVG